MANAIKLITRGNVLTQAESDDKQVCLSSAGSETAQDLTDLKTALDISVSDVSGETFLFLGDSWTAGTAEGNDIDAWPYYLELGSLNRSGIDWNNQALNGRTAATIASTFAASYSPLLTTATGIPSTCFVFAGINDTAGTITQLRDNLRSIWTAARNAGSRVVAFTLPHRTAVGGWSQSNWAAINAQIIADASYYDILVRADIVFSNALSADFSDNLHVTTAAHKKFASRIVNIINGGTAWPSLAPDMVCSSVGATTFSANDEQNLGFDVESIDSNADATSATVGGDANTTVFTAPVDGTYEAAAGVLFGSVASGDVCILSLYVTPIATGTPVEHRLCYHICAGANQTIQGQTRVRLLRGDTVNVSALSSKANAVLLGNNNFSLFAVRLVSIP